MALVNEVPVALVEMRFACGCSLPWAVPALLLPRGSSAQDLEKTVTVQHRRGLFWGEISGALKATT